MPPKGQLLLLMLLGIIACGPARAEQAAAGGEAGPYKTASFAEDAGEGWLLMRCDGEGADRAAAMLHARQSILYTLASTRLAQSAQEQERLRPKLPALLAEAARLLRPPSRRAGRQGHEGLIRQSRRPDGVAITLMAEVDEAGTRKLLDEWGVLDKIALPDGRKIALVLMPATKGDREALPIAQALLFKRLGHLPVEWLDPPSPERADHAANLAAAKRAKADLLIEIASEKKEQDESVAYLINLQAIDLSRGRIAASVSVQGPRAFAQNPKTAMRALHDPIADAVTKLVPPLTAALRELAASL